MIRVTLDVNVLVSGFSGSSGPPAEIITLWLRREFVVVLSEHILEGVEDVWDRPYWRARVPAAIAGRAVALLRTRAMLVAPDPAVRHIGEDEEDDLVLATAVAGNANYLVTGDRFLQGIGGFRDVTIVPPRRFLEIVQPKSPTVL